MKTRWVIVVSPRGDVVRVDDRYSEYRDANSLFGMSVDGQFPDGTPVTVRGTHIALAWRESWASCTDCGTKRP